MQNESIISQLAAAIHELTGSVYAVQEAEKFVFANGIARSIEEVERINAKCELRHKKSASVSE